MRAKPPFFCSAAAAYALLTELEAFTPGLDDQQVVAHMFVDRPKRFVLDYNSTLFQSMQEGACT